MNLEQLRQQRKELLAKMESVSAAMAAGTLTDEQAKEFDAAEQEFAKVDANIKRLEKLSAHSATMAAPRPAVAERQVAERAVRGAEPKTQFESIGEFVSAVRFNPNDQRLEYQPNNMRGENNMSDGPSGGFAVPQQFRAQLLSVEQAPAVVRPRATVIEAGSPPDSAISMPTLDQSSSENMYGGVEVSWIAEGGSKPLTDAKLKEIMLQPKEVAASLVVSDKLLRNWQACDSMLRGLLSKAMSAAEDDAFLNGTGVGRPLGIINSGALVTVNRASANTVTLADILAMEQNMLAMGNPVWLMTPKVRAKIRSLNSSSTGGSLIWGDGSIVSGQPQTLLGRPALMAQRLPQLGSKGDLCLVDLGYYIVKDGSGPFIAASEHVYFQSNKTMIKAFWNVDGQPWLSSPITEENGDIQSPFVALDVPSV